MDMALVTVCETLACEFEALRSSTVVRVLSDCADEFPYGGPHFIEQAARARLSRLDRPVDPARTRLRPDSLDVSLHDPELAEEVTLTVALMVAANESDAPLHPAAVDEVLGIVPSRWPVIPSQASSSR
jgi:hypothetical protein